MRKFMECRCPSICWLWSAGFGMAYSAYFATPCKPHFNPVQTLCQPFVPLEGMVTLKVGQSGHTTARWKANDKPERMRHRGCADRCIYALKPHRDATPLFLRAGGSEIKHRIVSVGRGVWFVDVLQCPWALHIHRAQRGRLRLCGAKCARPSTRIASLILDGSTDRAFILRSSSF